MSTTIDMPGRIVNDVRVCGETRDLDGAVCIIDNAHPGRPHFGQNSAGTYVQWEWEVSNDEAHPRWGYDVPWGRSDSDSRSSRV